ncbi:kinase-like domain-containing protein [Elsinoe ampelina]|uniref:Kinase-like domain-containing protein n=1 Tax=Elsinoe ampelina TaxID=302913 RepID=A0A6A6GJ76_9PEZI|nr:kinase-like domain-containing protein [Elsinoe ampelina]
MLKLGQTLQGRLGSYVLASKLQETVWKATSQQSPQPVIVKYARHWRIRNERDMLLRFQDQTPHLRRLLDEVDFDGDPDTTALILQYLDRDSLSVCNRRRLTRAEIKFVAQGVLLALDVLHEDGFVHTDVKPSNILVDLDPDSDRITNVQLADLESTVPQDSKYAIEGDPIGTSMFRSPEAALQMRWGQPTDVWSFGTTMISLIYGDGFHIFKPDVPVDHDEYEAKVLIRQHEFFGPFPASYAEIANGEQLEVLTWIMNKTPREALKPFRNISPRELTAEDKSFLLKIMRLDPRDRPTVKDLLADEWFRF